MAIAIIHRVDITWGCPHPRTDDMRQMLDDIESQGIVTARSRIDRLAAACEGCLMDVLSEELWQSLCRRPRRFA